MILCVHHFERGACQENTWPRDRIYCQVLVVIPHCRLITYYVVVIVKPDYFKYKPCKTGMGGYYHCTTYDNYRGPYGGCRRQTSHMCSTCIQKPFWESASFWPLLVSKRTINWQSWPILPSRPHVRTPVHVRTHQLTPTRLSGSVPGLDTKAIYTCINKDLRVLVHGCVRL